MSDWDAARYHRVSDPQVAWGRTVAARLAPVPEERILDVGCGTGRLTAEIAASPGIVVVGLDRSAAMLSEVLAIRRQTPRGETPVTELPTPERPYRGQASVVGLHSLPAYVRGDATALPFAGAFDAVFSAATFHWVHDHDRLFESIYVALKRGGRLVAQCGGAGNLQRLYDRARALMEDSRYPRFYTEWTDPFRFEGTEATRARLERAGFTAIDVALVPAPTRFGGADAFAEFIECVCLRHQLAPLPPAGRVAFVAELTRLAAADDPPLTLDYWRLNIAARKDRS